MKDNIFNKSLNKRIHKRFELVADPVFKMMIQSPQATEAHLTNRDGKLRVVAVLLMTRYWDLNESFARKCKQLALEDDNSGIRASAAAYLGDFYKGSKDRMIGKLENYWLISSKTKARNR